MVRFSDENLNYKNEHKSLSEDAIESELFKTEKLLDYVSAKDFIEGEGDGCKLSFCLLELGYTRIVTYYDHHHSGEHHHRKKTRTEFDPVFKGYFFVINLKKDLNHYGLLYDMDMHSKDHTFSADLINGKLKKIKMLDSVKVSSAGGRVFVAISHKTDIFDPAGDISGDINETALSFDNMVKVHKKINFINKIFDEIIKDLA